MYRWFQNRRTVRAEFATYIIQKNNWEEMSQKTKKELNDEKRIIGKIDHTKNWKKNIANMFENLEIIKKND